MKKALLLLVLSGNITFAYCQETHKKENGQWQHRGIPFELPNNKTRDVVPEEKPVQKLFVTVGMENYARDFNAAFMPSTGLTLFRPGTYSYGMFVLHTPAKPRSGFGSGFKQL